MMTDPIADLLTRIRNAVHARSEKVDVPASKLKANIVRVLRDEGYIRSFKLVREEDGRPMIKIQLKYDDKGHSIIKGIRRVSKPGLRRYVKSEDTFRIRNGIGTAVLSTSKGVITGQKAKVSKVGGEYLCEVW